MLRKRNDDARSRTRQIWGYIYTPYCLSVFSCILRFIPTHWCESKIECGCATVRKLSPSVRLHTILFYHRRVVLNGKNFILISQFKSDLAFQCSWKRLKPLGNPPYLPPQRPFCSVLGSMSVYQIFLNCQSLNDLRVWIYDLCTLITWLWNDAFLPADVRQWVDEKTSV